MIQQMWLYTLKCIKTDMKVQNMQMLKERTSNFKHRLRNKNKTLVYPCKHPNRLESSKVTQTNAKKVSEFKKKTLMKQKKNLLNLNFRAPN